MKRQKIRKIIILISFLFFPVLLYYFSPVLVLEGASKGLMTGSLLLFSLLFLFSLFLGRAYCGWVCPAGGLQEYCGTVHKKPAKGGKLNYIKYFIWVPWVLGIAILFWMAGGFKTLDIFYQTQSGISVTEPISYIVYYAVVSLIVVLEFTTGKRSFCHYVCWMAPFMVIGTKIKNKVGYPSLHLEADSKKCIQCKTCTKNCPMGLPVHECVKKSNLDQAECILCGTCIDQCPQKAISYGFKRRKKSGD